VSAPHVFVDRVDAPHLTDEDRHHLERVLRVRAGDIVTVSDGRGAWRECRFGPELEPAGPVVVDDSPVPPITVALALTKRDKPELAVQKLTEVGADRIVLLTADRSVARWDDDRAGRGLARVRRVAREAAMQSRRTWLPAVEGPVGFTDALAMPAAALADMAGEPPSLARPSILIGPEGGWSDEERAAAVAAGVPAVRLGPHVLRAETAAVVAGALLAGLRASIVFPGHTTADSVGHLRSSTRSD
jgi:16S rRNA (uracil1498-N3)-methyltransferase